MPGLFSRMFRRKTHVERNATKSVNGLENPNGTTPVQSDPWDKTSVRREDVVELLKMTCDELKLRGMYLIKAKLIRSRYAPFLITVSSVE
jgi:hypothetical protein